MQILKIPAADKSRLKVMFLAKRALATGAPDPADGNHAIYHHEMRTTLEQIGLNLTAANSFDAICGKPDVDYVVTLLNRGGFLNSEMLAPLMLTRHGIAFMGASPIIRGLGDDKHLMKLAAAARGVPVTPWMVARLRFPDRGARVRMEETGGEAQRQLGLLGRRHLRRLGRCEGACRAASRRRA